MARNFIASSSQGLRFGSSIATILNADPINQTCLAKARFPTITFATQRTIFSISSTTNGGSIHLLCKAMEDGQIRSFIQNDVATSVGVLDFSVTLVQANVWHTVGHVKTGDLVQTVLDAAITAGTTASPSFGAWSASDTLDIGELRAGTTTPLVDNFMEGDVAEVAVWSVALTQSEITAYHNGMSPLLIRPANLIFYAPLYGNANEVDLSGQSNGTAVFDNSPIVSSHPPVSPFTLRRSFIPYLSPLSPYAPPVDPDVNFDLGTVYTPPTDPNVNFDLKEDVEAGTLQVGELQSKYKVIPSALKLSELQNKYGVGVATLGLSELQNEYAIETFVLKVSELQNKYKVIPSVLKVSELQNKYKVIPSVLKVSELQNEYAIETFVLGLGELQSKYKVIPSVLKLGELLNKYGIEVTNLQLSEVQNKYSVQDKKLEAQLNAIYSLRFAKQLSAIYGSTVARQLLAMAFYTVSKQLESIYTIRGDVAKQLDSIYDISDKTFVDAQLDALYSMARITTQLEGIYSLGPIIRTQLDAKYILATVPVAKQLDSIYDIKSTNSVLKQLKAIYSILTTQIINITGQPTVTLGTEVFDISDADIGIDEGSFVWRAKIGILNIEDYVKFEINNEIVFNLYGETFNLVVESKMLSRSGPAQIKMGIIAVSPAIKFDFPRADALDLSFTSDTSAEAAAELALAGENIDWQIPDWTIPANRLAIKDGSPIQLVKLIVEAAGGILESKPDGTLVARPLFPISLPDFDTSTVAQTYTDNSDNMSVSEKYSPTKRLNKFRILDISSQFRDTMEFEFDEITTPNGDIEISTTDGILKIFTSPFRENVVVKSSQEGNVAFQLIGTVTEQLTEQVEFKEGFATLSRPIESVDTIVWEGQNLGALTFTAGDTKVFSASVVNLYGLATITYTTKFIKYRVHGQEKMNTQFRLLEVS